MSDDELQKKANTWVGNALPETYSECYIAGFKDGQQRIAEQEAISKALIKTLQISLPNVAAPLRESFELAIAKAKDKLRGLE